MSYLHPPGDGVVHPWRAWCPWWPLEGPCGGHTMHQRVHHTSQEVCRTLYSWCTARHHTDTVSVCMHASMHTLCVYTDTVCMYACMRSCIHCACGGALSPRWYMCWWWCTPAYSSGHNTLVCRHTVHTETHTVCVCMRACIHCVCTQTQCVHAGGHAHCACGGVP